MERISHGDFLLDNTQPSPLQPAAPSPNVVECPPKTSFNYLFQITQKDPANRLPDKDLTGKSMALTLRNLGNAMTKPEAPDPTKQFDSAIPSAYTYFGQFITHEVVFEVTFKDRKFGPDTLPLDANEIATLQNARTTLLDLDSLYGPMLSHNNQCFPVRRNGKEMVLGIAGNGPTLRGYDLLREVDFPFTAIIGDRRNDSNLITSQLHLAFLRAHNVLVNRPELTDAEKLLRQHFQWLVLEDYLPRVVDRDVLDSVRHGEIDVFKEEEDRSFMPLEFSAAAFRFAHSMPRTQYDFNNSKRTAELTELFLPRPRYSRLLPEWIIDWARFTSATGNFARRIDTRLVQPLFSLIDSDGKPVVDSTPEKKVISLAALDLLRGYLLGLPTGQAAARALGETELTPAEVEAAPGIIVQDQMADDQQKILRESGLSSNTPLWFYILAEAAVKKRGACLGRVGSMIVAGVLVELVRRSTDSILNEPNWAPTLENGTFNLADLFKLAGVLPLQLPT